jgi:hypothetical protein
MTPALSLLPTPERPAAIEVIDLRSITVTPDMYRTASALVAALPRIADALGIDLTAPRKDRHDRR